MYNKYMDYSNYKIPLYQKKQPKNLATPQVSLPFIQRLRGNNYYPETIHSNENTDLELQRFEYGEGSKKSGGYFVVPKGSDGFIPTSTWSPDSNKDRKFYNRDNEIYGIILDTGIEMGNDPESRQAIKWLSKPEIRKTLRIPNLKKETRTIDTVEDSGETKSETKTITVPDKKDRVKFIDFANILRQLNK